MRNTLRPLAGAATATLLFGCSNAPATGPDDAIVIDGAVDAGGREASIDTGVPISCERLGPYCHDFDRGFGPVHECHERGHEADPAWCAANLARCYELCTAAMGDAAAPSDAPPAVDATADGAADAD